MRGFATMRWLWILVVAILVVVIVLVVARRKTGGRPGGPLASVCDGSSGRPKPINGPAHQSDIPANWGPKAQDFPLGANHVRLRITPVANVGDFGVDCLTNQNVSYIVARIEYVDPTSTTSVAELPAWTDHTKPVYLQVKQIRTNATVPDEFDYSILIPSGTNDLSPSDNNDRHGFGYRDALPSAGKDHAQWGVPSEHMNDDTYKGYYRKASNGDVPAPPSGNPAEVHTSADRKGVDPAQAAWFSCSQGCCTATGVI